MIAVLKTATTAWWLAVGVLIYQLALGHAAGAAVAAITVAALAEILAHIVQTEMANIAAMVKEGKRHL